MRLTLFIAALTALSAAQILAEDGIPDDLPLPSSAPIDGSWLREATLLQPYGHSEYEAMAHPGDRPATIRREFGFNGIVVQPTDSHNATVEAKDRITDEQSHAGVAAYRAAGYRIILYTSLTGMGASPEFQSGQIAREHPDWWQRDPKGNPIMVYGQPWLCPNTGARQAALDRAVQIAREYQADGVLLDNNQFYFAPGGWTCHCPACTRAFRGYVQKRFGVEKSRETFGKPPDELLIPTEEGPLHALWMTWRNRVLAEINETFRAKLREVNPQIIFFGNTQYLYDDGMLGTDDQYDREDIIVSESVGLNGEQMSRKMMLGHALAKGRPLWNYIGTFVKSDDYTGLRPAGQIGPLIEATIAHGARPWIVDGFDEGATDAAAHKEMARLLGWHAAHEELFRGEPWAGVGSLVSLRSRNALHRSLIPPHWAALQTAATPVIALRDDEVTHDDLKRFAVMTIETSACLSSSTSQMLADWVRGGGCLIASQETGMFDELGRKRNCSSLWKALELDGAPTSKVAVGKGEVIAPPAAQFASIVLKQTQAVSFGIGPTAAIEVTAYRHVDDLVLHVLRKDTGGGLVELRIPARFHVTGMAEVFVPGANQTERLPLAEGNRLSLKARRYCIVKMAMTK